MCRLGHSPVARMVRRRVGIVVSVFGRVRRRLGKRDISILRVLSRRRDSANLAYCRLAAQRLRRRRVGPPALPRLLVDAGSRTVALDTGGARPLRVAPLLGALAGETCLGSSLSILGQYLGARHLGKEKKSDREVIHNLPQGCREARMLGLAPSKTLTWTVVAYQNAESALSVLHDALPLTGQSKLRCISGGPPMTTKMDNPWTHN